MGRTRKRGRFNNFSETTHCREAGDPRGSRGESRLLALQNFFKDDHWSKLPAIWQENLKDVNPPELMTLLTRSSAISNSKRVWPLSLLALQVAVDSHSIPRDNIKHHDPSVEMWSNICVLQQQDIYTLDKSHQNSKRRKVYQGTTSYCEDSVDSKIYECSTSITELRQVNSKPLLTTACLTHPRLRQVFKKHVKPKKRHEIEKLAQVVASTAQNAKCNYVIDVGSGVGHLSRMLAYGYGLKVCCIEQQDALSSQGTRLDIELEKTVSKHLSEEEMKHFTRPVRLNFTVDHDSDQESLIKTVKAAFGISLDTDLVFGIVGLHTCGDLAATLMQLFANCPDAVFLNIVGCCYMKLTLNRVNSASPGYPISAFCSTRIDLTQSTLSYEALEVACHANEIYCQQLREGKFCDQKVHCYRAALEEIIANIWPELQHSSITSVKCTSQMSFTEYCAKALSKLNVTVPVHKLTSMKTLQNLSKWKQVVIFAGLRLMLAPLVETIVLLDRLAYCRERGFQSSVVPIFDPVLSPRNHVLIATRL